MAFDAGIKGVLDGELLTWGDVTARRMFGGAGYMVRGSMFAALVEGAVAMKLPDEQRGRALTLAGVSPFSPTGGRFGEWVQFLLLLNEDVPTLLPWLREACDHVAYLPATTRRRRSVPGR